MSNSVNRRTVVKGVAATITVTTVGVPALAAKSDLAKAHEFIRQADELDFRYFVNCSGQLGFWEGSNGSNEPNWNKKNNWPQLNRLRKEANPTSLPMHEALAELGRVEPPMDPCPDFSMIKWTAP